MPSIKTPMLLVSVILLWSLCHTSVVSGNPTSKPFIPFRTLATEQNHLHHPLTWDNPVASSGQVRHYDMSQTKQDPICPLKVSMQVSHRVHHAASRQGGLGIVQPPVIFPILPEAGPGRQVLYTTQYEHLDMLTISNGGSSQGVLSKGSLTQHMGFPLLFESSSFLTSPVLMDANSDGIVDVILSDYDGGIYAMGLKPSPTTGSRWFHRAQVPRLFVRRDWVESRINETLGIHPSATTAEGSPDTMADDVVIDPSSGKEIPHDPYHTYFEYSYGNSHDHETILRGVAANVLGQDHEHVQGLEQRRTRTITHAAPDLTTDSEPGGHFIDEEPENGDGSGSVDETHRRLEEVAPSEDGDGHVDGTDESGEAGSESGMEGEGDDPDGGGEDDAPDDDNYFAGYDDMYMGSRDMYGGGDDIIGDRSVGASDKGRPSYGDDDYPRYDDGYHHYDDYYGRYNSEKEEYYDEKHYVRLPPHIVATPVAADVPKMYSQTGETEVMLFLAVSYYFDEDEYEGFYSYKRFKDRDTGDESEVQRGMYVANAIMVYQFGSSPRWGRQEHLDMSTDHTAPINSTLLGRIPVQGDNSKMGAFALGSPTVADIDGDGSLDVLMGTSMGIVYALDARNLYSREGWPVQFERGIESRILVEDVVGDTNLEVFVSDVGGTVACLNHKGEKIWHRNLLDQVSRRDMGPELVAASPMMLGDVNVDGKLDLVVTLNIRLDDRSSMGTNFVFVLDAATGVDLPNFPLQIGGSTPNVENLETALVQKLPAPLLVDLHTDQSWLPKYLERNGKGFTKPAARSARGDSHHGGSEIGLHIVQPIGKNVVITEAATGCSQTIVIGEEVRSMVQADDLHGNQQLDLVATTASGNVVTLSSPVPYHPLNVWNNGEVRGRTNAFAHGYSSSQGIFVSDFSRTYRDIFGVFVPVTFTLFDNRPNIANEPNRQVYNVEVRVGMSQVIFRKTYNKVGTFTERMYIPSGPGHYQVSVVLKSTHGIVYEDTFHVGYNVNYMEGFGLMLWLPLLVAVVCIFAFGVPKSHWDDDDYTGDGTASNQQGILGGQLPE